MSSGPITFTGGYLPPPKPSNWRCRLTPGPHGLILQPTEDNVPNAFHRWMQRICFGFCWEQIDQKGNNQ